MIIKRLLILLGLSVFGMGVIFVLPSAPSSQPVGVNLDLPPLIGSWYGMEEAITERERLVLGADTEFARRRYRNNAGEDLFVSIVLSGQDMNTSIHLPERCLPAQGWTIADKTTVPIPVGQSGEKNLRVTRLYNMRPAKAPNGMPFTLYAYDYYWFVGHQDTTASHWVRTYYDIRDRVLKGYNQRWAYVTVLAVLNPEKRPDAEVDGVVQGFIRELVPVIHKESVSH